MGTTSELSSRLKSEAGARILAERWLADLFARPIGELIVPAEAARAAHEILTDLAKHDGASEVLLARLEVVLQRWEKESKPLEEALPEPWAESALRFASRPHAPHRQVVLKVLDREPVRQAIRALLIDALVEFGKRVAAPISGSRVGKGLGALGSLAGAVGAGVLGAVGGELEKGIERKAAEFADAGLSRVLHRIVDQVSDPRHAREQAELRATLVQGVLDVPVRDLVAEVRKSDPRSVLAEARRALQAYVDREDVRDELERELTIALEPVAKRPLGEELAALGIRDAVERAARELLVARIRTFDWASAFDAVLAS